jgi:phosphate uptake regulator
LSTNLIDYIDSSYEKTNLVIKGGTSMTIIQDKRNEERRKIQLTGRTTYTVSLPKKWILLNQLQKNSSLLIREETDGSLSIRPPTMNTQETAQEAYLRASPKESPDALIRKTVSAYLVGYNFIHVEAQNRQQLSSRQRSSLKSFARNLLVGTEIVTDCPTELTLQVLLSYPELPVQNALRRMSIIAASMHRESMTALGKLDYSLAKDVLKSDDDVDRFNMYIVRQLKMAIQNPRIINEIGLGNARDCLGYRLVTKSVERTADHAVNIAENTMLLKHRLDDRILKRTIDMSSLAVSMFENAIESLFRSDYNLAEASIEKTKDILTREKEAVLASQQIGVEEAANLRLIIESVRRTAEYAADIAEIVLNLTVESVLTR